MKQEKRLSHMSGRISILPDFNSKVARATFNGVKTEFHSYPSIKVDPLHPAALQYHFS